MSRIARNSRRMAGSMLALVGAAVMTAAATGAAAGQLTGVWKTSDGGYMEVFNCGQAVCGRISPTLGDLADKQRPDAKNKNPALRNRKIGGLQIMSGFVADQGRWTGGKIYNPRDGNTYTGTLTLQADGNLLVKGCVVAPLCRTQTWSRVTP